MYTSGDLHKIVQICIVVLLCCEMQPSNTQLDSFAQRILDHRADINGTEATFNSSKYHASIRLRERDDLYGAGHICSGAVIAPSVVLTAASCVYDYHDNQPFHPAEFKVVLGSLARYHQSEQSLIYSVTHVYLPKTFDGHNLRDNVAILMLERDIPSVIENVQAISWLTQDSNKAQWYNIMQQRQYTTTTWLRTKEGFHVNPLMSLDAFRADDNHCKQHYGAIYGPGMLCISSETSSRQQDLGSPLFVDNELIGLLSAGGNNHEASTLAIYTDVSYHSQWIRQTIGNGCHRNSSIWGALGFLLLTAVALKRSKFLSLQREKTNF